MSARKLSDEPVLPFDLRSSSDSLRRGLDGVRSEPKMEEILRMPMQQHNVTLEHLEEAIDAFAEAAANWTARAQRIDREDPLAVRAFNDQV